MTEEAKYMIDLLNGSEAVIRKNIDIIAEEYKKAFNKNLCKSCPASIALSLIQLKRHYMTCQFKFKRPIAQYKIKKGDKATIHNGNITDEKAIEFLKVRSSRIELFSEYPKDIEIIVKFGSLEAYEAAKAEEEAIAKAAAEAAAEAAKAGDEGKSDTVLESVKELADIINEESLSMLSMDELRNRYPDIHTRSKDDFIQMVLQSK